MIEVNLVPLVSPRVSATLRFGAGGGGVYFTNPNQIQKFSVNAEAIKTRHQAQGRLFQVGESANKWLCHSEEGGGGGV